MVEATDARWQRLMGLLEPIHEQAAATSRRLCRSNADGDDLYQDAVLRAFEKLNTLRDESRFRSWFFAVLLNRHRSRCRQPWVSRRFLPWDEAFPDAQEPMGESGEEWAVRARQAQRVARALATLPAEQREAIVLCDLDGLSIEAAAALQGASLSAVKSRLVRGRARLRRFYERLDSSEVAAPPLADAATELGGGAAR